MAGDFTALAEDQFDEIYESDDIDLANALVDACDLILNGAGLGAISVGDFHH